MIKFGYISFLILLLSSCTLTDKNRNQIVFEDPIDTVQNALFHVEQMLDSLPFAYHEKDDLAYYGLDNDGYLTFNKFHKHKISENLRIPGLSDEFSSTFLNLILFLRKNYISGAYQSLSTKIWTFSYRDLLEGGYDEVREIIVFNKDSDTLNLALDNKIIEHKGNLLLIAPKDAKMH